MVLTEFRANPGVRLLAQPGFDAYHFLAGDADGPTNCTCILSRTPIRPKPIDPLPMSAHRLLVAELLEWNINLFAVHVPNQNEIWNKREFWHCIDAYADANIDMPTIIIGDLNTALDEDCQGAPIREAIHFRRLLDVGWIDAWRKMNHGVEEYSWYSHRNNGFRLDHGLLSPCLATRLAGASMRHDVRIRRISDHSLLRIDLDFGYRVV